MTYYLKIEYQFSLMMANNNWITFLTVKLYGMLGFVLQLHVITTLCSIYQKYAIDRFVPFQLRKLNSLCFCTLLLRFGRRARTVAADSYNVMISFSANFLYARAMTFCELASPLDCV